jgi:hypothetical protein
MKREKYTNILDNSGKLSKPLDLWEKAITDAHEMIKESRNYIRQLKGSIQIFERLRDRGAPFPGATLTTFEASDPTFEAKRTSKAKPLVLALPHNPLLPQKCLSLPQKS